MNVAPVSKWEGVDPVVEGIVVFTTFSVNPLFVDTFMSYTVASDGRSMVKVRA